jgi:uncharacterized membrane protein YbhN (UPF0104 family)
MIVADVFGSSLDAFLRAADTFFENLAAIEWAAMALALALWAGMMVARGHAWANALRASYPAKEVSELRIQASFLAGAGINAIIPARAGDAAKIFLAKQSIPGSSYPAMAASFAVLTPFDTTLGLIVLGYALTLGLLPDAPEIPELPAFEIAFWFDNPDLLVLTLTLLGIGTVALYAYFARRVEALWQKLKQGVAILRTPRRYLREVAAWQFVGWLARFAAFWFFLEAFGIGGSLQNVGLLMAVQAIATALPFTPGGAGAQQALLVATLEGPSRVAVLSFSVGQQIAVAALAVVLGFFSLFFVFRTTDWRGLIRRSRAAVDGDAEAESSRASP